MALTWDCTKIVDWEKNYPSVVETGEDGTETYHTNYITWAIIIATMMVDIGEITAYNYREFYFRLSMHEKLFGSMITWQGQQRPITLAEVKDHVGLRCNVVDQSRSKFMRRVGQNWEWEVKAP
jgi:hypothetical protein